MDTSIIRKKIRELPLRARIPLGVLGLSVLGGIFYNVIDKSNFGISPENEIREEYGGVTFPNGTGLDFEIEEKASPIDNNNKNLERIIMENDKSLENIGGRNSYEKFSYPSELSDILKHSERIGVEPELIMAIRMAENGRDDMAYGIIPQGLALERYNSDKGYKLGNKFFEYSNKKEKQLCWAEWTVKRNYERFLKDDEGKKDFIDYLADKYAPIGVGNDPDGLNANWEKNVRMFYEELKEH